LKRKNANYNGEETCKFCDMVYDVGNRMVLERIASAETVM